MPRVTLRWTSGTPIDVREFRSSWAVSAAHRRQKHERGQGLLRVLPRERMDAAQPGPHGQEPARARYADLRNEQKLPFSDEELRRMYDACETKYGKREIQLRKRDQQNRQRRQGPYPQHAPDGQGRTWRTLFRCRYIPACAFPTWHCFTSTAWRPDGAIQLRTTKADTHVYTWVPEWLQERIRTRALETVGPYIFGEHRPRH